MSALVNSLSPVLFVAVTFGVLRYILKHKKAAKRVNTRQCATRAMPVRSSGNVTYYTGSPFVEVGTEPKAAEPVPDSADERLAKAVMLERKGAGKRLAHMKYAFPIDLTEETCKSFILRIKYRTNGLLSPEAVSALSNSKYSVEEARENLDSLWRDIKCTKQDGASPFYVFPV